MLNYNKILELITCYQSSFFSFKVKGQSCDLVLNGFISSHCRSKVNTMTLS